MLVELRHDDELIATLKAEGKDVWIVSCIEAFRNSLQMHIDRGINLPGEFSVFNASPGVDGEAFLQKMANLYSKMYRITVEIKHATSETK